MPYRPISGDSSPATRLTDAQRDRAVERLTSQVASGRLAIDDFDRRAGRVYAAVTQADLDSIFRDLPSPQPTREEPQHQRLPMSRELLTWASVGVLCLSIWAITSIATGNFLYPWPIWVIGPWGAMLAVQRVTGVSVGCRAVGSTGAESARLPAPTTSAPTHSGQRHCLGLALRYR